MSRAFLVLHTDELRQKAIEWIRKAPIDTRVTFQSPRRTLPQNSRFYAMLTDIAQQITWHGARLSVDEWKLVMLAGLKRELRLVPNIDGTGFVNIGQSSSDLSKEEFSDLFELMEMFGAQHGVTFHDSRESVNSA
jgi:hypothetical protein